MAEFECIANRLSENYKLHPIPLSRAGNPLLFDEEVEIKFAGGVAILELHSKQTKSTLITESVVILTSHRFVIVFDSKGNKVGWGLNLSGVKSVEDCSTFFSRSSRISIQIRDLELGMGVKFPSKGSEKDDFLTHFRNTLQRRSWESTSHAPTKKTQEPETFSASNSGVAGILRRQEQQMKDYDSVAREAMTDLDSLMKRAKEVASVAQRCAAYMAVKQKQKQNEKQKQNKDAGAPSSGTKSVRSDGASSASVSDVGDDEDAENEEIGDILYDFGIASPVTRSTAGRLYHQQLSRQLAEFLLANKRLERLGGMATLTDVYGMFNRARGTELVSPDDLLRAAEIMGSLNIGIAMKIFPSGVKTIQYESFDDKYLSDKLLELLNSQVSYAEEGIGATDVSRYLRISLVLAKELLLGAEARGMLCRDDSIEGLAFFANRFVEVKGS
jgi:ESCRT-II complex subunit VPS36